MNSKYLSFWEEGHPCHLTEPDGTSELAREHACPGGLCHGHFTLLGILV